MSCAGTLAMVTSGFASWVRTQRSTAWPDSQEVISAYLVLAQDEDGLAGGVVQLEPGPDYPAGPLWVEPAKPVFARMSSFRCMDPLYLLQSQSV